MRILVGYDGEVESVIVAVSGHDEAALVAAAEGEEVRRLTGTVCWLTILIHSFRPVVKM